MEPARAWPQVTEGQAIDAERGGLQDRRFGVTERDSGEHQLL